MAKKWNTHQSENGRGKGLRPGTPAAKKTANLSFPARMALLFGMPEVAVYNLMTAPKVFSGRINTLKVRDAAALYKEAADTGFNLQPLPWYPHGFSFAETKKSLAESELVTSGKVFIQNASSFLPVLALEPQEGDRILDACAAPGAKSSFIAALASGGAELWLNDGIKARLDKILDVQRVLGFEFHALSNHLTQYIDKFIDTPFDKILLDAQCSGEGMIDLSRRDALQFWSPERITKYRRLQTKMLDSCFKLLKPGGILAYSTCTLSPEEDEAPVSTLLERHADAVVEPLTLSDPLAHAGITKWLDDKYNPQVKGALRVRPHDCMEGFFVCRIRKTGDGFTAADVKTVDLDAVGLRYYAGK